VGNPWLDAGIVPFSTLGYRIDPSYWRKWFPADWISESFPGQFRNWFYSLLAMSTVMERKPPFLANFGYALLLGEDGREMHKSWGNAVDFHEGAEKIGVDVMRWMFLDHKPETNLLFGYHRADETRRRFHIPLWNVYSFFVTYANLAPEWWVDKETRRQGDREGTAGANGSSAPLASPLSTSFLVYLSPSIDLLDHWIVGRLQQVIAVVTDRLDNYDAESATVVCEAFLDDLSNWYVRRNRRRFWEGDPAALDTLHYVLVTFARLLAPMMPYVTETMYQNLVRGVGGDGLSVAGTADSPGGDVPESVHHTAWPVADASLLDERLLADMDLARAVVSLGHADRVAAEIKVRQPLAGIKVVVAGKAQRRSAVARFADVIADELNVKAVELVEGEAELVQYRILPVNKTLGPRFGKQFPAVRQALSAADPYTVAAAVAAGQPVTVVIDGEVVELAPEEVLVQAEPRPGFQVTNDPQRGIVVALDTVITPALKAEGLARELVRHIQQMRKDAGFQLSDRIHATYQTTDAELAAAIEQYAGYVQQETLSLSLDAASPVAGATVADGDFDGAVVTVGIRRAGG
jgi:isoleucyl-tRNA synthetase